MSIVERLINPLSDEEQQRRDLIIQQIIQELTGKPISPPDVIEKLEQSKHKLDSTFQTPECTPEIAGQGFAAKTILEILNPATNDWVSTEVDKKINIEIAKALVGKLINIQLTIPGEGWGDLAGETSPIKRAEQKFFLQIVQGLGVLPETMERFTNTFQPDYEANELRRQISIGAERLRNRGGF